MCMANQYRSPFQDDPKRSNGRGHGNHPAVDGLASTDETRPKNLRGHGIANPIIGTAKRVKDAESSVESCGFCVASHYAES